MNFGYIDTTKRNILSLCLVLALLVTVFFEPNLVLADTGIDGDRTLSPGSTILNRYAPVDAISGNVITVTDIAALADTTDNHYTNDSLSAGDLILIYQAQGASFTSTLDDETYGEFSYDQAGAYEFAVVEDVTGNDITASAANTPPYSCSGITKSYNTVTGNVQVVRVPQYTNLTIPNGATVTASPWDGNTGGVIALHVRYDLVVDGTIDASGLGFRGGTPPTQTSLTYGITFHRSIETEEGGEKGESILGSQADYDGQQGRFGRGAPANGGGGGNAHNAGGGGGANGLSGGTWNTGQGFVAVNDIFAAAWDLDDEVDSGSDLVPAYFQNGAGGGRGGYSFSDAYEDPTIIGIDDLAWNDPFGDRRRQVGGLGGRPLNNDPNTRLFFGGGGGSGDGNNASASPGGNGGGLVILIAQSTTGSGSILANGETASDTVNTFDDGAGGGGGGGTIIMKTTSLSNNTITVSANGGKGGNQPSVVLPGPVFFPQEAMGPGGGGGGGYVAVASGSGGLANSTVDGGANGITLSEAMNGGESSTTPTFPPNGATQGYSGGLSLTFNSASAFSFPGCQAPTAVTLQAFSAAQNPGLPLVGVALIVLTGALFTWIRRPRHSSRQ